jgi:hypothetical protein
MDANEAHRQAMQNEAPETEEEVTFTQQSLSLNAVFGMRLQQLLSKVDDQIKRSRSSSEDAATHKKARAGD